MVLVLRRVGLLICRNSSSRTVYVVTRWVVFPGRVVVGRAFSISALHGTNESSPSVVLGKTDAAGAAVTIEFSCRMEA